VPEGVCLGDQHLPMIWRHDLAVHRVGQPGIERVLAEGRDLGQLERPEGTAVGDLDVVGDRLVVENQQGVLLEGRAHRFVGLGIGGDVENAHTLDLDAEARSQRNQFHCAPPMSLVGWILSQPQPRGYSTNLAQKGPAGPHARTKPFFRRQCHT
jgi:hypothetical protein